MPHSDAWPVMKARRAGEAELGMSKGKEARRETATESHRNAEA